MVRRTGTNSRANQLFMCNGVDHVYKYTGGGTAASTMTGGSAKVGDKIKGAKVIIGHRGRALFANYLDLGLGGTPRKFQRVAGSIIGDPETVSGTGYFAVDLDDDAFPIVAGTVVGGSLCFFKGDAVGGSIVIGTPTGVTSSPYRWDTINSNGVGLLCPRTLTQITPDLYFFVGHDGFYLYDGAHGLLPLVPESTRSLIPNITPGSVQLAHAYYDARTYTVRVCLPLNGATYPTEEWAINIREKRMYGPNVYAAMPTATTPRAATGVLQWTNLYQYGRWTLLPWARWSEIGLPASARTTIYGDATGHTYQDDNATFTDAGATVTAKYHTSAITPDGLVVGGRQLDPDTALVLHDVTVIYKDAGVWTPIVDVSIDGGNTWTTISDDAPIGDANVGKIFNKTYTTLQSSTWHPVRVQGTSAMRLLGLRLDFTVGGSTRAN